MKNLKSKAEYERMELLGAPDGSDSDYSGTLDGDEEDYDEEMWSDLDEEESPVDEDIKESNLSVRRISRYRKDRGPPSREFSRRQASPRLRGPPSREFKQSDSRMRGQPSREFRQSDSRMRGQPFLEFRQSDSRMRGPPSREFRQPDPRQNFEGRPVRVSSPRMGGQVRRPSPRAPPSPIRFAPSGVLGTVTFPAASAQSSMYSGMPTSLISRDSVGPQNPDGYLMPAAPGTPTGPLSAPGSSLHIGSPVVVESQISACIQGPPMNDIPPGSIPADLSRSLMSARSPGSAAGPSRSPISGGLSVPPEIPMSASPPAPPVPVIAPSPGGPPFSPLVAASPVSSDDSITWSTA